MVISKRVTTYWDQSFANKHGSGTLMSMSMLRGFVVNDEHVTGFCGY